jgi:hypothetical protein
VISSPPPLIAAAILAAAALPALLVGFRWVPGVLCDPGRRFVVSVVLAWLAWFAMALLVVLRGDLAHPLDWLAGVAVLVAATLAALVIWSLIVWGFTINLLLVLARSDRPLDVERWAAAYAGGRSMHQICIDRLGLLLAIGAAQRHEEEVRLVRFPGSAVAAILLAARRLFGVS